MGKTTGDKNIGYASSYDQRRSWYHPQIKIPVGERIARWALATQYGMAKQIRWLPPMLKDVRIDGEKIVLQLDSQAGPYHDGPIEGFAIAGADGRFQPANAEWRTTIKGDPKQPERDRTAIVLSSPMIPEPKYFRHAWGRNPQANLKSMDNSDLPLPTLRNDSRDDRRPVRDLHREEVRDPQRAGPERGSGTHQGVASRRPGAPADRGQRVAQGQQEVTGVNR